MGNQTFIEINGKKYDAVTGRLIQEKQHTTPVVTMLQKQQPSAGVVDGFSRRPARPHYPANHAAKAPQRSQTLMRHGVKKPAPLSAKPAHPVVKPSLKPPAARMARAQEITRSPQVKKFGHHASRNSVVKSHAELTVKQPPAVFTGAPVGHAIAPPANTSPVVHSVSGAGKMIEAALASAQSHHQVHHAPKTKRKSRLARKLGISAKTAALSSAVLSGVLLGGFFAVQNVPNLSMRVAATRAGFAASMPGYQPSEFSFRGPISYKTGQVTVSFGSNADSRQYSVVQTNSNWNSDALLANFITAEEKQYQTYLDRGRTLYIYDGSNATWVDDGIWYQIEGDSDLTTDQLIRIAASM